MTKPCSCGLRQTLTPANPLGRVIPDGALSEPQIRFCEVWTTSPLTASCSVYLLRDQEFQNQIKLTDPGNTKMTGLENAGSLALTGSAKYQSVFLLVLHWHLGNVVFTWPGTLARGALMGKGASLVAQLVKNTCREEHCGTYTQWNIQFSSVTQSHPILCDPMNCSTPGLPVHHQLLEFTQTHAH